MHPLEVLGLARDADERAVKRAYAQRLRTVRPDEDPVGFQKLHETYQSALSYLRWRAEHPEDEEDFPDEDDDRAEEAGEVSTAMSPAEFEALIGNPRFADVPAPPSGREPARLLPDVQRVTEMPEPFRLDVRDFLKSLFEQTEDLDDERFRTWLARETADWPLVVMPRVARDVLDHMVESEPDLTEEQLEIIVAHFGLDDVLMGGDPVALQQLRIEAAKQSRKRRWKFAHLFHPDNRSELSRYMAQPERGGHSALVTRLIVYLLTSSRAYEWAFALRPVPLLNRVVMGFLRDIDEGRFDAFGPRVDEMALSFWEWAEIRREANRGFRYVVVIVGLLAGLAYVTQSGPRAPSSGASSRPQRSTTLEQRQRDSEFAERLRRILGMSNDQAIAEYDALIRDLPGPPYSPAMEEIVALAHYNRGVVLGRIGWADEVRSAYVEVDRRFASSTNWPTQLVVAMALVNLSNLDARQGAHQDALVLLEKVLARYDRIKNERFDLQIAKALSGRAAAFLALGRREEGLHALDELLRRFGDRTTDEIGEVVTRGRARREEEGRRAPVERAPGAPAGSGATPRSGD